jgi:uncharacterized damage-inducible protein DinB
MAQQGSDPGAAVRKNWDLAAKWVAGAAELVPADKYSYRPAATVRTFAQLVGHITDSHNYYCASASGQKLEWSDPVEKGPQDRATQLAKLKQSIETCNRVYRTAAQSEPLIDNVAHSSLHYGNVITYLRMMGLTPPSS